MNWSEYCSYFEVPKWPFLTVKLVSALHHDWEQPSLTWLQKFGLLSEKVGHANSPFSKVLIHLVRSEKWMNKERAKACLGAVKFSQIFWIIMNSLRSCQWQAATECIDGNGSVLMRHQELMWHLMNTLALLLSTVFTASGLCRPQKTCLQSSSLGMR